MKNYSPIIGLEIHVELKTKSKMFCQCSADYFGAAPNSHVCPVCLGMPGALPVPNATAIEWAIKIGRALGCTINAVSKFDRKHYFYPDLPKGYQISQYDEPFAVNGRVPVGKTSFRIRRVHLEEDTGKLSHSSEGTLIDFNRSSVPLVEIVTEPDFRTSEDVKAFLEELQVIIRYLDVSDADMEKGSMRLEPNISVMVADKPIPVPLDEKLLPAYKVEVKNINSFRFVKMAIDYEAERQSEILEEGKIPAQETRGFDDKKNITYAQRSKEDAQDYRYFPEPDIPPITFTETQLQEIYQTIPELPYEKVSRYVKMGLREQDALIITRNHQIAAYFEEAAQAFGEPQKVANFIINKKIPTDISVKDFVTRARDLAAPRETDTKLLDQAVIDVCKAYPHVVADYKSGKENAVMFLVGAVMKQMKGKADARVVKESIIKHIA